MNIFYIKKKIVWVYLATLTALLCSCKIQKREVTSLPLKIWYNSPADATIADGKDPYESDPEWLKALPVGNGFLGAMVFGDVVHERIQLNEKTLWSGSYQDSNNPDAQEHLEKIRSLLLEGKYREANLLTQKTQVCKGPGSAGGQYGSYQTLGDLYFDFKQAGAYSDYRKELDLENGVVSISYLQNGTRYKREIFASYPDRVLVIRLSSEKKGGLNFKVNLKRPERYTVTKDHGNLLMSGTLEDGQGGEGILYAARLEALTDSGVVKYEDGSITVEGSDEVMLLLSASTDYKQEFPQFKGADPITVSLEQITKARSYTFDQLIRRHHQDYKSIFDNVQLHLSHEKADTIPTNVRLADRNDKHLQELYFQYGRYLLISSSRKGSLPANLQGIWANKVKAPWNGDYHTNINVQMNYWPADVNNMSDCFSPYSDLISSLVQPGAATATVQYILCF